MLALSGHGAWAGDTIASGSTVLASSLGNSPDFQGGTLRLDSSTTLTQAVVVENNAGNTIDADGHVVTMSGAFTGAGGLTFSDSVGGGVVTLTSASNAYTGSTTVSSGVTLALSSSGILSTSSNIIDNGVFDISTSNGATVVTLSGTGAVSLGAQNLTISSGSGAFSGTISGTGGLILTTGTEILSGNNIYSGGTTITAGTLTIGAGGTTGSIAGNVADNGVLAFNRSDTVTFSGGISGTGGVTQMGGILTLAGTNTYTGNTLITGGTMLLAGPSSIASSGGVTANGTFDISATGATIKSLSGTGTVLLGNQTLTLTAASGTFSGTISGSGNLVADGGTQLISGISAYTGTTTVNAGILQAGAATVTYNVRDNATFAFFSSAALTMSGVVSGTGTLAQMGSGTSTLTTAQTYTGATTISAGTLALSGTGSIAASSGLTISSGTFDISATTAGTTIASLAGRGVVQLGAQTLTLANASGTFAGVIAGTGNLFLTAGNQTLSGANSFTGSATISGGTLALASISSLSAASGIIDNATLDISPAGSGAEASNVSITSLAGSGQVTLGSNTLVMTNASGTFSGGISGIGGITVTGGIQTLSGTNGYTGITLISGGTLALAGSGSIGASSTVISNGTLDISASSGTVSVASLSGSGSVNLGARTLNLTNAADSFTGVLLGSGSLALSGGTETLSGSNSYTGGTIINAGTLQIGRGATSGSIIGNVTDNGTLAFDRTDSLVLSGAITGGGGVVQIGPGTTVLTNTSLYTGGTIINAGTLQIGNGGTSGSISGSVIDSATLAFDRSDSLSFAGTISGSGGVSIVGGNITLTAVNRYTGVTTIASGTSLILSGGGTIASSGNVADGGLLDLSAATAPRLASLSGAGTVTLGSQTLTITNGAGSFTGTIAGGGGVAIGGGVQTLGGINSYTGATTISGGTLTVSGSIASSSSVAVASGGTLSGNGTVSAITVAGGGTLAPGLASAGTLTSSGPVTFASNSVFLVETSNGAAGKLAVTGAASLAGTLKIASADGTYALGQKLTVLTAGSGISGTFTAAPVQSSGAQLSSAVSYDADNVYVEINLAKLSPLLPAGASVNQANAIGGIDAAIAAGDTLTASFQNLANLSSTALGTGATQLSGEIGTAAAQAGRSLFDPLINSLFDRMTTDQLNGATAHPPSGHGLQYWAAGCAGSSRVDGDAANGSHTTNTPADGFVLGADWSQSKAMTLGGALSVGSNHFDLAGAQGSGKTTGLQASGYGVVQFSSHLYGAFAGVVALDSITTARTLQLSGTDQLDGKMRAYTVGGRYETGARFSWGTPYAALEDTLFVLPSYGESASSGSSAFALNYAAQSANYASAELGLRQNFSIPLSREWAFQFTDRLGWAHGLTGDVRREATFAALPDSRFATFGAEPGKDALLISLGMGLQDANGFGMEARFDSSATKTSQTYTGTASLHFNW